MSENDPFSSLLASTTSPTNFTALDATSTTINPDSYALSELLHTQVIQPDKSPCLCRSLLISHMPRLEMMMQETPKTLLERVLKATKDVIASCQAPVDCPACQVGPVDLVCIVSVFSRRPAASATL
jgi:hypothetical protein